MSLKEIKKKLKVIESNGAYEYYSDGATVENEKISFCIETDEDDDKPLISEKDKSDLLEFLEIYYIAYRLNAIEYRYLYDIGKFIIPEGVEIKKLKDSEIKFYLELSKDRKKEFLSLIDKKIGELKKEGKRIFFLDRLKWEESSWTNYCSFARSVGFRRRLAIYICDKNVKHEKLKGNSK